MPEDRVFIGFDAYQKAIAAGPDIVLLATPPGFRPIHYAAAVAAGKHVFMEKPCCVDAPGFRSLMETNKLADEKGLKVVVGLQRRHSSEFLGKVKRIQDGALGEIMFMRAYWNGGPIWVRERKPEQTEMEYQMRNWYHFVWLCGDHIVEQHVHNLDVCNWVKGDHPIKANGMGSCHCRRTTESSIGQIYDNHFVEFTYKDGTKLYSQCRQQPNTWEQRHPVRPRRRRACEGTARQSGGDGYKQEHVDLVDAIRKGEKLNDGWHGATSSFTAVLGRMATYSGQEVNWDEAVAKGPRRDAREVRLRRRSAGDARQERQLPDSRSPASTSRIDRRLRKLTDEFSCRRHGSSEWREDHAPPVPAAAKRCSTFSELG